MHLHNYVATTYMKYVGLLRGAVNTPPIQRCLLCIPHLFSCNLTLNQSKHLGCTDAEVTP